MPYTNAVSFSIYVSGETDKHILITIIRTPLGAK